MHKCFPGWPYKTLEVEDKMVLKNLQAQIDLIDKAYMLQLEEPDPSSDSASSISGPDTPPAKRPRVGSTDQMETESESGSD